MPFHYICETCGVVFKRPDQPNRKSKWRWCSRACRYAPRPGIPGPDGTVLVPLSQGYQAVIDEEDAERVLPFNWAVSVRPEKEWTPYASGRVEGRRVLLHRFLMDAPPGIAVDHVDGNGLNNRRVNLRYATQSQNLANRRTDGNKTSPYRGVRKVKKPWYARIGRAHIGAYETEEEAARAYDAKARELFGEFARLNFPDVD